MITWFFIANVNYVIDKQIKSAAHISYFIKLIQVETCHDQLQVLYSSYAANSYL